jgi:hypothetical protein
MAALDSAHSALALGLPTAIAPRLSAGDPRPRHRGVSHHTEAVLRLLLAPVRVAAPQGSDAVATLAANLRDVCGDRHRVDTQDVDLAAYASSGLPTRTMGREIGEDPDFFAGALAGGALLAEMS